MKASQKRSKAKEYLWLAVSLMCLVVAVHSATRHTFKNNWYFFIFAAVAFLFYLLWRGIRKKSER
jgi:cell division protein FtsW (lipid II flippase)